MEHQLAKKSMQKEQSKKTATSFALQSKLPEQATLHPVLRLQRAVGNQTVQNLMRRKRNDGREEESLQTRGAPGNDLIVPPKLQVRTHSLAVGGQPLSESTRAFMESGFGYDFSNVRIHVDGGAATTARNINAAAYTAG